MQGKVIELYVSTKDKQRQNRESLVIESEGVLDDKFFAKGVERSILISSLDSYNLALKNSMDIPYGSLGENIIIDINPYALKEGDKIQIGEAILEITQNCTICNSLSKVAKGLPKVLKSDRGIFAKCFKVGRIYKNDPVKFL
jgi:MOSC domain-containing protein YiiM